MAFTDGISITINSVPLTFFRRSTNGTSAVYSTADDVHTLTISHQITKDQKIRSVARLDTKKIVADPLTNVNDYQISSSYTVQERPQFGFTNTEVKNQMSGFSAWHILSATQDKLLARES